MREYKLVESIYRWISYFNIRPANIADIFDVFNVDVQGVLKLDTTSSVIK